ncbi:hypothetical protein OJ967_12420 [Peribacillus frigoritolerans]|uniref:hypothetical protein n=1 Tax=Peribacillus frigoritolerans TaxID=450367 RepID=UPI0022269C0B|nr:hypothetical protein [Peribacillus frigoritolerans]UYZ01228.1 hypothetical protein OJ967_12420 [Peribacillus frigoritolerans]
MGNDINLKRKYFKGDSKNVDFLLKPYVREIQYRYEWAVKSFVGIGDAINNSEDAYEIMRHAVDVIGHAVVIHRIVTGSGARANERERVEERVMILRDKFKNLKEIKTPNNLNVVRNHYEHFDAKLDEWATATENNIIVDMNVAPPSSIYIEGIDEKENLRSLDPETTDLVFWSKKVNLREVIEWAAEVKNAVSG